VIFLCSEPTKAGYWAF